MTRMKTQLDLLSGVVTVTTTRMRCVQGFGPDPKAGETVSLMGMGRTPLEPDSFLQMSRSEFDRVDFWPVTNCEFDLTMEREAGWRRIAGIANVQWP